MDHKVIFATLLTLVAGLTFAQEPTSEDAMDDAIAILSARKLQMSAQPDQDRTDEAIAALQQLQTKNNPHNASKRSKKLAGQYTYNAKTGELTVSYDFRNPKQLADFTTVGGTINLQGGMLVLEPGQSATTLVKFKTVTVTGLMGRTGRGAVLATTSGAALGCLAGVYYRPTEGQGFIRLGDHPGGSAWRFKLVIDQERSAFGLEGLQGGAEVKGKSPGQIGLLGGENGGTFARLVFVGTVDPEWAAEFFKP